MNNKYIAPPFDPCEKPPKHDKEDEELTSPPDRPVTLFTAEGTPELPGRPALLGGRCNACGYTAFPLQVYGCENCGSELIEPKALSGRGRLVASAEVFIPAGAHRPAPFTIGSIVTDDGAVVRALLDVPAGTSLSPGRVMVTSLVPETRPDRSEKDLRFTFEGDA